MYPKVHVLYITPDGLWRLEEREAQGDMSSTSPHDYGLTSEHQIVLVMFKATALAVWLDGMQRPL